MDNNLFKAKSGIRLDIGCGANKQPGFVGMDIRSLEGVDIVHDFEVYPWPIPDCSVILAIASHVVEHVNPANFGFVKFMDEVWRISQVDGQFAIATPYAGSFGYFQDPTHVNPCNEATWAYFAPEHPSNLYSIYTPKPWKINQLTWDISGNMEVLLTKIAEEQ